MLKSGVNIVVERWIFMQIVKPLSAEERRRNIKYFKIQADIADDDTDDLILAHFSTDQIENRAKCKLGNRCCTCGSPSTDIYSCNPNFLESSDFKLLCFDCAN